MAYLTKDQVAEALACFSTRQRTEIPASEARVFLEKGIFMHRADAAAVTDAVLRECISNSNESAGDLVATSALVDATVARVAAPGSAEEVAAAFNALGANQAAQTLARDAFVEAATASDAFIVDRAAEGAFNTVCGGGSSSRGDAALDFLTFRSTVNEVIHSTKIGAKA